MLKLCIEAFAHISFPFFLINLVLLGQAHFSFSTIDVLKLIADLSVKLNVKELLLPDQNGSFQSEVDEHNDIGFFTGLEEGVSDIVKRKVDVLTFGRIETEPISMTL